MINILSPCIKTLQLCDADSDYNYLLAVSSDSLYILSSDKSRIVETIIDGIDNNGWMFSAETEDDFLDGINIIKKDILSGNNPLDWLL